MRTIMLILLICILTQATGFGELTKQDLEAIQKVVKEEISDSEQRTDIKLAEINTEIKVIKTDIKGVKDRVDDIHGLAIAVIGLLALMVIIASAVTYAAGKLGSAITEIQKVHTSNDETKELLAQNTEARKEQNRLVDQYTAEAKRDKQPFEQTRRTERRYKDASCGYTIENGRIERSNEK